MPILYLIRGLPGSGKTTLARDMVKSGMGVYVEADMYFEDHNGNYNFDPNNIKKAHEFCIFTAGAALIEGHNVIVSNTFSRIWEMEPYLILPRVEKHVVITCEGDYGSVHGVPADKIEQMKQRWERWPK